MTLLKTGELIAAAALAVGLALGASACTGSGDEAEPPTGDTGSSSSAPAPAGDPATAVEASLVKVKEGSYSLSLTVDSVVAGDLKVDNPGAKYTEKVTIDNSLTGTGAQGQSVSDVVCVGEDVWVKPPAFTAEGAGIGDRWVHATKADLPLELMYLPLDMKLMTDQLVGAFTDVAAAGERRYTAIVDPATVTSLRDIGVTDPVEVTVTLDANNLFQELTADIPNPVPGAGGMVSVSAKVTGYDITVDAAAPDPSQVVELGDVG